MVTIYMLDDQKVATWCNLGSSSRYPRKYVPFMFELPNSKEFELTVIITTPTGLSFQAIT